MIAALLLSLGPGALTGALDLWNLRVVQRPVPLDHHQAHAVTQLFGFMWLLTVGISFHLAPRLFGAASRAVPGKVRLTAWCAISGVILAIVGHLGALVRGSAVFGSVGVVLMVLAGLLWAEFMVTMFRQRAPQADRLVLCVMAGTGWWLLSLVMLALSQLGSTAGGPLAQIPLEAIYASALFGGTASWLVGISFRAGACTLKVDRPSASTQRVVFVAWQVAALAQVIATFTSEQAAGTVAQLLTAMAMVMLFVSLKPWRSRGEAAELPGPAIRQAMLTAHVFGLISAVFMVWKAALMLGAPWPPLLLDVSRHAFTLGFAQVMVLAFAGRMLPGFEGAALPRPSVFNWGIALLALGAALRVFSVFGPWGPAMRSGGLSGFVAWAGLLCVSSCVIPLMRASHSTSVSPSGGPALLVLRSDRNP